MIQYDTICYNMMSFILPLKKFVCFSAATNDAKERMKR